MMAAPWILTITSHRQAESFPFALDRQEPVDQQGGESGTLALPRHSVSEAESTRLNNSNRLNRHRDQGVHVHHGDQVVQHGNKVVQSRDNSLQAGDDLKVAKKNRVEVAQPKNQKVQPSDQLSQPKYAALHEQDSINKNRVKLKVNTHENRIVLSSEDFFVRGDAVLTAHAEENPLSTKYGTAHSDNAVVVKKSRRSASLHEYAFVKTALKKREKEDKEKGVVVVKKEEGEEVEKGPEKAVKDDGEAAVGRQLKKNTPSEVADETKEEYEEFEVITDADREEADQKIWNELLRYAGYTVLLVAFTVFTIVCFLIDPKACIFAFSTGSPCCLMLPCYRGWMKYLDPMKLIRDQVNVYVPGVYIEKGGKLRAYPPSPDEMECLQELLGEFMNLQMS